MENNWCGVESIFFLNMECNFAAFTCSIFFFFFVIKLAIDEINSDSHTWLEYDRKS